MRMKNQKRMQKILNMVSFFTNPDVINLTISKIM